jgi:hypothetical protein
MLIVPDEGDAVGEDKIAYRAGGNTEQISSRDPEPESSHKNGHDDQIASYRKQTIRDVELRKPVKSFPHRYGRSVSPRPPLMPDKVI